MKTKQHISLNEITAEHEEWSKIISKARELFPHSKDVVYKLTVWCYATLQPRYPVFKIQETSRYFFHTLEDARNKIPEIIEKGRRNAKRRQRDERAIAISLIALLSMSFPLDRRISGETRSRPGGCMTKKGNWW